MNCISRFSSEKWIFRVSIDIFWMNMMMRLQQKAWNWLLALRFSFYWAGKLVFDNCAGSLASAKACMRLPIHCRFAGCEKDSVCIHCAICSLFYTYQSKIWVQGKTYLKGREQLRQAQYMRRGGEHSRQRQGFLEVLCRSDLFLRSPSQCLKYIFRSVAKGATLF